MKHLMKNLYILPSALPPAKPEYSITADQTPRDNPKSDDCNDIVTIYVPPPVPNCPPPKFC